MKISILIVIAWYAKTVYSQKSNKNDVVEIITSAQCEICKERIEKALIYEPGVKDATLDLVTMIVKVTYKSDKIQLEEIKKVISKTGYDADDLTANQEAYEKLPLCCRKNSSVKHVDK